MKIKHKPTVQQMNTSRAVGRALATAATYRAYLAKGGTMSLQAWYANALTGLHVR